MSLNNRDFPAPLRNKPGLYERLHEAINKANKVGANAGAHRLALVGNHGDKISLEEANRLIDLAAFRQEIERTHIQKVAIWYLWRNLLAFSSLLWTVLALSLAVFIYQQNLLSHPLTFSLIGLGDALLLAGCLFFALWAQAAKQRTLRASNTLYSTIQQVADELIDAIANDPRPRSGDDVARIVNTLTANSREQVQSIADRFENTLNALNDGIAKASATLTQSSSTLAVSSTELSTKTDLNVHVSKDLTRQLNQLNDTQNKMVNHLDTQLSQLSRLNETQNALASNLRESEVDMSQSHQTMIDVAKGVKDTAALIESLNEQLKLINPNDVNQMTNQATIVASTLSQLNAALQQTNQELQKTAQILAASASAETSRVARSQDDLPETPPEPQPKTINSEHLRFSAYHPRVVPIETQAKLLVYSYVDTALQQVMSDAALYRVQMGSTPGKARVSYKRSVSVSRGSQITIVPKCPGVTFEPEQVSFTWVEDMHKATFSFQANKRLLDSEVNGEILIFAGPLIIATLKISFVFVGERYRFNIYERSNMVGATRKPYDKIFASYSHKDRQIVLACRNVLKGIGSEVFIDRDSLKAGEDWRKVLWKAIEAADVFLLYWSTNSAKSQNVRDEWEQALPLRKSKGTEFIRPIYWEEPMETEPEELSEIHFAYMDPSLIKTEPRVKPLV